MCELCFSEVIIKTETNGWEIIVLVHFELVVLFAVFLYSILVQSLAHVQVTTVVFPRVAGCVCIVGQVTRENFTKNFF